ncbi:GNAT family N-acetyltransferase [Amylibacter sp. SFDW26]|uniref:GNAT family N-acetyltransferase n=1 Tax=Amylibacter sp. SFDW26 TaxID=2652722 RepID=UPI001262A8A0|nr:GNAT family N-acetyltransferase [Amylibacter sp. SFDW26]KAB7613688.1 GNAT family N-acetyltransferase [Amylibacter sp. SFDW26]
MSLTIRAFDEKDIDAFRTLYQECLAYYQVAAASPEQEERVISLLIAERHMACHIAFDGTIPLGFATWGLNFPAGAGISLVMKELFVSSNARGKGVGKALLSTLIDVAREEGCTRFDWATDGTNKGAQKFYAALDAPKMTKQSYRISSEKYEKFQSRLTVS